MTVLDINKDLSALFSQQVRATPDAVAIEDDEVSWTYAELDRAADLLAAHLRSSYAVGRDSLVGVIMGHNVQYILSCVAALKAGGAFLVLEVAYPPGLLAEVLDDSKPAVIITSPDQKDKLPATVPMIVLARSDMAVEDYGKLPAPEVAESVSEPLPADTDLDRLAFVSYSSGSTGRPKGIGNPHTAAVRSYDLRFGISNVEPGDRVACNVFFVWEMLRPLLRGAAVVAVPDDASYDPVNLVNFLHSHKITETLMTPTLLATVLGRYPDLAERVPTLKTLWLNGEVVTVDLVRRASKALPQVRLLNCYSASETHEIACCDLSTASSTDDAVCPVGKPLDPEHTYVLDEEGMRVSTGTTGELFVGGQLLARGYLKRPEMTIAAFLTDAFDHTPGARMYRTGDRARMLPTGELEILGRMGGMIKVRGYTVQPATVESAIVKHLAVRSCVVLSDKEGLEKQLVAYVVLDEMPWGRSSLVINNEGHSPLARRLLAEHLAHYMIPVIWVQLDALPTHKVSGKVDVKNLPRPPVGMTPPETPPPERSAAERKPGSMVSVAEIKRHWAACLGVDESNVSSQYDFFDLGGHSLALASLASRMSKFYGVTVPLVELARTPTLEAHWRALLAAQSGINSESQDGSGILSLLKEDCVLAHDIQPAKKTRTRISEAENILLTGATGFLGAFLLDALVAKTTATISCLVRPGNDDSTPTGMARLRKHLLDLGLWQDSLIDRIEIIDGDMTKPNLGLSDAKFDDLAASVQSVVHAGANVNLVYPYDALRDSNIGGTKEILRLAARSGASVHYVSTNGVLPTATTAWGEDQAVTAEDAVSKLESGYDQTKWVSEQLVLEAARRGIPATIYRPGTLGGHSRSGSSNERDVVTALLIESLCIGHAPKIDGWRVEMTPVDFASNAIVALADRDTPGSQKIFHVGDPDAVTAREVFGRLAELGYPTKEIGWHEWVALWTSKRGHIQSSRDHPTPAGILRAGMPSIDFLRTVTMLDDKQTRPCLETCGLRRPKIDMELLKTYTRHFYSRGWLAAGPRMRQAAAVKTAKTAGPLAGKVAIVTGASSGIGAAIATALARDGAHVALAARRTDSLKTLQARLESQHDVKVLSQQTDVTSAEQVESLVRSVTEQLGPVDIFVSCAGVMYFTMMASVQTDEWDRTVDVNCKGLLHCLASTVPPMLKRGAGHIVAISSDAGRKVFPGLGVYSGSKFFVEAVLQSLRLETAGTGIRVTSVQPGNTATELLSMSTDPEAMEKYGTPTGAKVLDPEDVASAVMYAVRQPPHVAVNEVLIEPRDEPI